MENFEDTFFRNAIYVPKNKWCDEDTGSAVRVLGRNTVDGIRHALYVCMKLRHRRQNVLKCLRHVRKISKSDY